MMQWIAHTWSVFLNLVGHANPVVLFLALAVLPLIGFPASILVVAIGMRLGTPVGMLIAGAAYLVNFTAGYWLARSWFRAPLHRWLERRGQRLPVVAATDENQFILLVRVTPGPPLFFQTYTLGFAKVHFGRYLLLSMLVQLFYTFAFLSFGQSLNNKALWHAVLAVGLLIGAGLAVSLLRKRLIARRAEAAKP
jgi:uncharacterized membrane protein YdjX (TVP38/TMEM64 family)